MENKKTGECECRPGFIFYIKSGTHKCVRPCYTGEIFDESLEKCICKSDIYVDGNCLSC